MTRSLWPASSSAKVELARLGRGVLAGLFAWSALQGCGSSAKQGGDRSDAATSPAKDASQGGQGGKDGSTPADDDGDAPTPPGPAHAWSREPPGGKLPSEVPQLVAITFDDNFGLANEKASGGVDAIVQMYAGKTNPTGAGKADDFDGKAARTTFYHTTVYVVDESEKVPGGGDGEDHLGRNRAAWMRARAAGHEVADHTIHHFNGGVVPLDPDDCCRARNFDVAGWKDEIGESRAALVSALGVGKREVIGFRSPFLGYNDALFAALSALGFRYDSSLPNCFDDSEDGKNCAWPYTLDQGSPDTDTLARVASSEGAPFTYEFPKVKVHAGLWELPPTTLVIPPDELSEQYGFDKGLRARVAALPQPLPYPTMFDPKRAKIAGLDYSLLIDAQVSGREMGAILQYNLDLHLSGNRSPLIFIAHSHLYAYTEGDAEAPEDDKDNPDTPSAKVRDERLAGLRAFLEYALARPEVRVVAAEDVLAWMQRNMSQR